VHWRRNQTCHNRRALHDFLPGRWCRRSNRLSGFFRAPTHVPGLALPPTPATPSGRSWHPWSHPGDPVDVAVDPPPTPAATSLMRSATWPTTVVCGGPCQPTSRSGRPSTTTTHGGPPTAPSTGCTTPYASRSALSNVAKRTLPQRSSTLNRPRGRNCRMIQPRVRRRQERQRR
jgi:hypothetical protein